MIAASPIAISFVEGKPDRDIHRDLLNLRSYAFSVDNDAWLSPGEGNTAGTFVSLSGWPASSHPDGSTTGTRVAKYLPEVWVGANAHLVLYVSEAAADAGNFRINATVRNWLTLDGTDVSAAPGIILNETSTTAAGAANTPLAVTTATFAIVGQYFNLLFQRIGADAADTATQALIFWGALLVRE